jgi:hypothetical protein
MRNVMYHMPCSGNHREPLPDAYSLTIAEIESLLHRALRHLNDQDLSSVESIKKRLVQGIPYMKCPVPKRGPLARKAKAIEEQYTRFIELRDQDIPTLAAQLHTLMEG